MQGITKSILIPLRVARFLFFNLPRSCSIESNKFGSLFPFFPTPRVCTEGDTWSDNIRLKRCVLLASPSSFAPLSYTPYENPGRLSPSEFNKLKRYERKKESFYVLIRFSRGKASRVNYPPLRSVLNDIYIYPLQGCKVLNGENYGCTCVCVCVKEIFHYRSLGLFLETFKIVKRD